MTGSVKNKKVVPMFRIFDVLFINAEKAQELEDGKERMKSVFVAVDEDFDDTDESFFEAIDNLPGVWVFNTRKEAWDEVNQFNEE